MAGYSIGDRVEVRWKAKPFAAKVLHVHSSGKVDAVYVIDGSVGVFLTVEEHGLKLLGDAEKKAGGGRRRGRYALRMAARTKRSAKANYA